MSEHISTSNDAVTGTAQDTPASRRVADTAPGKEDWVADTLAGLDRAHRMSCSDPSDPRRVTTYSQAAKAIRHLRDTEHVLRGQIRRDQAALDTFDEVVAQRDALAHALALITHDHPPALPIGTRVRVANLGTGTVVGADGTDGTALRVFFDRPAPKGYSDGACVSPTQCEVIKAAPTRATR